MAELIAEDGTGRADANSYCSVDFADEWLRDHRGDADEWLSGLDSNVKSPFLVSATDWLDRFFAPRLYAARTVATQALCVPCIGLVDRHGNIIASTVVPDAFKRGCAELAFLFWRDRLVDQADGPAVASVSLGSSSVSYAGGVSSVRVIPSSVLSHFVGMYDPTHRVDRC